MSFVELLKTAFESLALNKMRTGLAALGIIIGIGAVIGLVSIGQAGQKSVEAQIQSLGSNLLTVTPGAVSTGAVRGASGGGTTLTYSDALAISTSSQITTINNVSPELSRRTQITAVRNNTNVSVTGVTPAYALIRNIAMDQGSYISSVDVTGMSKVAVIGPQVVSDLFGAGNSAVGKTIRVNKVPFQVIGVTASKGGSGFINQDDMVFIPISTAQKQIFGVDYLTSISLEAKNQNDMTNAENEVGYFLLTRHKISNPALADFSILSQADILGAASQVTSIFTTILAGIAAISLLVGGIGIMNIMLVTVTERTREIGLRKALGAKRKTIIRQFLTESIILTIVGGILGTALGIGLSFVISAIIKLPFVLSGQSILLSLGVSGTLGILFGWYPAQKAANLTPIEALRYE